MSAPDSSKTASDPKGTSNGRTLRDEFAMHAPITLADARQAVEETGATDVTGGMLLQLLAQMRWRYADAMLAERERNQ